MDILISTHSVRTAKQQRIASQILFGPHGVQSYWLQFSTKRVIVPERLLVEKRVH